MRFRAFIATSEQHCRAFGRGLMGAFDRQPGFADSGSATDQNHATRAVLRRLEGGHNLPALDFAAHELGCLPSGIAGAMEGLTEPAPGMSPLFCAVA